MDHSTHKNGLDYQFDLSSAGRGNVWIRIEKIRHADFPGYRPIKIWGNLKLTPSPQRDRKLIPVAVKDDETWAVLKEAGFEGGHLIGLHWGGPDSAINIAPLTKGANSGRGTWGTLERAFTSALKASNVQAVSTDLTIGYDDSVDPRIPARIRGGIQQRSASGVTAQIPVDTYIAPPPEITACLDDKMVQFFQKVESLASSYVEDFQLVELERTKATPNAPLDVIDFDYPESEDMRKELVTLHPLLATYPRRGALKADGRRATPVQRHLMMFYNRFCNLTGRFKASNLTAEDRNNLGLIVKEWQAQYDHTHPRSQGGSNHYRNLVLTHFRVNNKRGAGPVSDRYRKRRDAKRPVRFLHS